MKKIILEKGFSLLELLIYMGILTGFLIVMFSFTLDIIYGDVKSETIREVQQNSRFAVEKMIRVIKTASRVNSPAPGSSSPSLSLAMNDSILNPTVFDVVEGKLRMRQGFFGQAYNLTSDHVLVSNITFTNRAYPGQEGLINIDLDIEYNNPSQRNEYEFSLNSKASALPLPGGAASMVPGYCGGTPIGCSNFVQKNYCENQDGCVWGGGACGGECTPCEDLNFFECFGQQGCSLFWFWCTGTCTTCDTYEGESPCESQMGCDWAGDFCSGIPVSCDTYISQITCVSQDGCEWIPI